MIIASLNIRKRINRNTNMATFTPASQTAEKDWEQDLEDILHILEEENSTSSSHLEDNSLVNWLDKTDEGQWLSSPLQHSIGQEVSFLQTTPPLAVHNSRVSQKELQIQRTVNFLRTSGISNAMKTKSNASPFPGNEHLDRIKQRWSCCSQQHYR